MSRDLLEGVLIARVTLVSTQKMQEATRMLTIEVGGKTFRTSTQTIQLIPFIKDAWTNANETPELKIDRSPEMFKYILDHSRGYSFSYPTDFESKMRLIQDCDFYRVDSLLAEIVASFTEKEKKIYAATSEHATDAYNLALECIQKIGEITTRLGGPSDDRVNIAIDSQKTNWTSELRKLLTPLLGDIDDIRDALVSQHYSKIQLDRVADECKKVSDAVTWHQKFLLELSNEMIFPTAFIDHTGRRSTFEHFLGAAMCCDVEWPMKLSKLFPSELTISAMMRFVPRVAERLLDAYFPVPPAPTPGVGINLFHGPHQAE